MWTILTLFILIHHAAGGTVNVALNKPAMMSSYYGRHALRAGGAVDGRRTPKYPNVVHTASYERVAWWKVDLERKVQDATVRIYFRTDHTGRRNGVKLYTSREPFTSYPEGHLCGTVRPDDNGYIPDVIKRSCPGRWRYLMVFTNTSNDKYGPILDFGEVEVEECAFNFYGPECSLLCSDRKCLYNSSSCHQVTGHCVDGCEAGYNGTACRQECARGFYGYACSLSCTERKCNDSSPGCDHVTGRCSTGCQAGYNGTDCTNKCARGFYGYACSLSCTERKCNDSSSECDHVTGRCSTGCQAGYNGTDCTNKCEEGFYGRECRLSCTDRKCIDSSAECHHVTGRCSVGCQAGYNGTDCRKRCEQGSYGSECSLSCTDRKCIYSSSECDHVNGRCSTGCQFGYNGADCRRICPKGRYGPNCSHDCSQCKTGCEAVPGQCPSGCGLTSDSMNCEVSGQSGYALVIACSAVGGGIALVVVFIVVIYKRRKTRALRTRRSRQTVKSVSALNEGQLSNAPEDQAPCLPMHAAHVHIQAEHLAQAAVLHAENVDVSNNCVYYNVEVPEVKSEIAVADLESSVARIAKKKGFSILFEKLPEGFLAPYEDACLPVNAGKNKYKQYYPYDHNRVRLSIIPGVPGSDYINASIMHIYDNKTYIAAQAPKQKTVVDFWRMIWEQRCGRVIMLTGLVEGKTTKCYKYWPEKVMDTEQYHIELTSTDQLANHTVRYLQVTSYETQESRRVVQYHYTTWPDHGIPDTLAMVNFIWMVRRTHTRADGLLLVHCSAGIGRTGTYIAVDSLLDQAREEGKVDVHGYVSIMREQRKNMIQTTEQYECVFNCLVEMTKYGNTSLAVDDFTTLYTKSGMDAQLNSNGKSFRELAQMIVAEQRKDSPDEHRIWVDGNQAFVVTALPSLRNVMGHLVCESPHPGLEKLLWKMVEENNIKHVIVLSQEQHFVDLTQGSSTKQGEITLTCFETRRLESELFFSKLKLEKNSSEHEIKVFSFDGHVSIENVSAHVLDHAPLRAVATESDPVLIVHSPTDQHIAVSLSILLNVMAGVLTDRLVDITGHIRTSLNCCPRLQLSEHDVEELHNVALRCVVTSEEDGTYANM